MIDIFKGEGRYLFQPCVQNMWDDAVYSEEHLVMDLNANAESIGTATQTMLDYIEDSPKVPIRPKEQPVPWRLSEHGIWIKFFHNNLLVAVMYYEDRISVFSQERRSRRGGGSGYCGQIERIDLPVTATKEELGEAILQAFDAAEKFYSVGKYKPKRQRKTAKTEE